MSDTDDTLYKDIVILHTCFSATEEDLFLVINSPEFKQFTFEGVSLERIQRKGDLNLWWYLDRTNIDGDEDKPFVSKVETVTTDVFETEEDLGWVTGWETEIKISCSNHPCLVALYREVAERLFRDFHELNECDKKLPSNDLPKYQSLMQILLERGDAGGSLERPLPKSDNAELPSPDQSKKLSPIDYLPTTDKALARWKEAYGIIENRRQEYLEDFQENRSEMKSPTIKDYQVALAHDMGLQVGEKTVRNIIKTGDAGLLN